MPFDVKKKLCYVHIPKTGGTSVCEHFGWKDKGPLWDHNRPEVQFPSYNHASYLEMQREITKRHGTDTFEEAFKFATVRNPLSRFLSAFIWMREKNIDMRPGHHHPLKKSNPLMSIDLHQFIQRRLFRSMPYLKFMFQNQMDFLKDTDGKIPVDMRVMRMEQLQDDFDIVNFERGAECVNAHLGKVNTTRYHSPHHSFYFEKDDLYVIEEEYDEDFDKLGYDFERVPPVLDKDPLPNCQKVVINLPHRADRRDHFKAMLRSLSMHDYIISTGVQAKQIGANVTVSQYFKKFMKAGHAICVMAFRKSLQDALAHSDKPYIMVMEDDCSMLDYSKATDIAQTFSEYQQLADHKQRCLFLGYLMPKNYFRQPSRWHSLLAKQESAHVFYSKGLVDAHCVIYPREMAIDLVNRLPQTEQEALLFIAAHMPYDMWLGRMGQYYAHPCIMGQRKDYSDTEKTWSGKGVENYIDMSLWIKQIMQMGSICLSGPKQRVLRVI